MIPPPEEVWPLRMSIGTSTAGERTPPSELPMASRQNLEAAPRVREGERVAVRWRRAVFQPCMQRSNARVLDPMLRPSLMLVHDDVRKNPRPLRPG